MTWRNCYRRNGKILLPRVIIDDAHGNTRAEGLTRYRSPEIAPGMDKGAGSLIGKNGRAQNAFCHVILIN